MPDAEGRLPRFGKHARSGLRPGGGYRQHHSKSAIEDAEHFISADISRFREEGENRRHRPASGLQHCRHACRQYARQIARQTAAGDMRRRMQQARAMQGKQRLHVNGRWRQQGLA